jgi:hypothetical protein
MSVLISGRPSKISVLTSGGSSKTVLMGGG